MLYGAALGILFSALNVYLRDVQYLVQILLMLSLWASPIVYGWSMVQDVFDQLRPAELAAGGLHEQPADAGRPRFPQGLLDRRYGRRLSPDLGLRMLIAFLIGLVVLWLCQRVFARLQGNFAQEL